MILKPPTFEGFAARTGLLEGRVILITGATGGLGRALSVACARAGATVILCGRNPAKLERLYDEIEALGCPQPAIAVLDLATATAPTTTSSREPLPTNSAGSTDSCMRLRSSATERRSSSTTCRPGARCCT
jgi:NAD(P)-dependent dehydrogenase (short-subunit alcohol dehydrogenase family)